MRPKMVGMPQRKPVASGSELGAILCTDELLDLPRVALKSIVCREVIR